MSMPHSSGSRSWLLFAVTGLVASGALLGWLYLRGDTQARLPTDQVAQQESSALDAREQGSPQLERPAPVPRDDDSERVQVEAQATQPAAQLATTTGPTATVQVEVRLAQKNTPYAGCNVHVMVPQETPGRWSSSVHAATDADGHCQLEVPVGAEFALEAGSRFSQDQSMVGWVREEMTPFLPGERREVLLVLPNGEDAEFYGRLVVAGSGTPLAGGRIRKRLEDTEGPVLATSDADGLFHLRFTSWRGAPTHWIDVDGHGPATFRPTTGYADPTTPLELALRQEGILAVRVVSPGAERATVRAETKAYELGLPDGTFIGGSDPTWTAELDGAGRAELALPARVPLKLTLEPDAGESLPYREPITLSPGERREITWQVGTGARLTGQLLDQNDEPVAGAKLWLSLRALAGDAREGTAYFYSGDREHIRDATTTDAEGRFAFEDVPEGFYWCGPRAEREPREVRPGSYAPLATGVEILAGDQQREVLLRTWRGLVISGQILDPWGKPAPEEKLSASSEAVGGSARGRSDADGNFRIGPLVPGEYVLRTGLFSDYAAAEPVRARAGATGVVLMLREAGGIEGIVVDAADGAPVATSMWVSFRGVGVRRGARSEEDGRFARTDLEPGLYDIAASTQDGRAGVLSGVEVRPGEQTTDLRIELKPGARLTVLYTGPTTYANYTVFQGEVPTAFDGLHTGTSATKVVPAGTLRVQVKTRSGLSETREITLAPDAEETLAFEFE